MEPEEKKESIISEARCAECNKEFKTLEALEQHNKSRHYQETKLSKVQEYANHIKKHWNKYLLALVFLVGIVGYGTYLANKQPTLTFPPTTMQGHTETKPSSHILKTPMDMPTFKHMLEHVDGIDGARGGIIITYDCVNWECEDDIVEKLEAYARNSDYIYVAPYKNQAAKIIMTRLNWQKIIEDVVEIDEFI